MNSHPLVCCIMPTYNRRAFVPKAIAYFLRQDFPNKDLIVMDDGTEPIQELVPTDDGIRHVRVSTNMTTSAKRNLACAQAQGDIIAQWDDDDWHAPHRLRYQVVVLLEAGAEVCGLTTLLFYDLQTGRAWQYTWPSGQSSWVARSYVSRGECCPDDLEGFFQGGGIRWLDVVF